MKNFKYDDVYSYDLNELERFSRHDHLDVSRLISILKDIEMKIKDFENQIAEIKIDRPNCT